MSAMRQGFKFDGRALPVLALALSLLPGCITEPDTVTADASNSLITVVSMQGQSGAADGFAEAAVDLFSDVCEGTPTTLGCSVFNDNGVVTMRGFVKDRQAAGSEINTVTFERYRVTYIRADGRNVVGVDVPYPFDGAANFTVPLDGTDVDRGFTVVRHQAKGESPLRELSSSLTVLSVIARIDFYGHDGAGRAISATAHLNITFADFADTP